MKPGDIILIRFPFSDAISSKKRPALLLQETKLSAGLHLLTVAMITSRIENPHLKGDVLLIDWEGAKLLHPSLVRLAKIATVDHDLAEKVLGSLSDKDLKMVKKNFRLMFHEWI
ncbi:MAG: hypothetical protein ACD_73C00138G0001 [uncultured bacterium]|nr:MAG: hypothetical protein ACD_73C00138G0001 [uncultured bacterium]